MYGSAMVLCVSSLHDRARMVSAYKWLTLQCVHSASHDPWHSSAVCLTQSQSLSNVLPDELISFVIRRGVVIAVDCLRRGRCFSYEAEG